MTPYTWYDFAVSLALAEAAFICVLLAHPRRERSDAAQLEDAHDKIDELEKENASLREVNADLVTLRSQLSDAHDEIDTLEAEAAGLRDVCADLRDTVAEARRRADAWRRAAEQYKAQALRAGDMRVTVAVGLIDEDTKRALGRDPS